ncbi:Protein of unknown function [Bacillus cereus]|nr:Protein of unknown function [Bacillus cereus]
MKGVIMMEKYEHVGALYEITELIASAKELK